MGVDIGGTNTVFGVVDARGEILYRGEIKTGNYEEAKDYLAALAPHLNELIEKAGGKEKFNGIGIGAPNGNFYTGTIENAPNMKWAKGTIVPFAKMVTDATGIPCVLTNDANAAAMGEMTYGVAKGMKHFIMITLGTGVGSGIVIDGKVVYGNDGFAGELGHVIMRRQNGRICGCGRRGCLEAYASAPSMALTARELTEHAKEKGKTTLLASYDLDKLTSKDVHDAALQGDEIAKDVFRLTGEILGEAFADFPDFFGALLAPVLLVFLDFVPTIFPPFYLILIMVMLIISYLVLEPQVGLEPTTYGLQNRCSTTELLRRTTKTIIAESLNKAKCC